MVPKLKILFHRCFAELNCASDDALRVQFGQRMTEPLAGMCVRTPDHRIAGSCGHFSHKTTLHSPTNVIPEHCRPAGAAQAPAAKHFHLRITRIASGVRKDYPGFAQEPFGSGTSG
jgi:hypothetical protein